ncbi:hypothetical protein JCGZ_04562 [Jatropha curcas]|uniref:Uncharacterized protein n=1 Tax=Jatropha curcas TaxID=180498 RepID=A0A067LH05_JATCU|nr:hypothetical protein JCGZ_04562 [Jatropha curcas]
MMPSVELLSLSWLNGSVPTRGLLNFKNLEYLDLRYSAINNSFGLQDIGMMRHLKTLLLRGCGITGPIPTDQGLCKLKFLQELDISGNYLNEIPFEIGDLDTIQMLNLSHNSLTGSIPQTFSNLRQIESLDLSYNNLEGEIPSQITQLYSLEVFSVAHNNLSGKTPTRVAQFGTFDEGSYEGNPFLCGLPPPKACNAVIPSSRIPINSIVDNSGFIDMDIFYVSFVVSYIIVLLGIIAVLYINPYWRQAWFYYVELISTNCYYFLVDNIPYLFKFGVSTLSMVHNS